MLGAKMMINKLLLIHFIVQYAQVLLNFLENNSLNVIKMTVAEKLRMNKLKDEIKEMTLDKFGSNIMRQSYLHDNTPIYKKVVFIYSSCTIEDELAFSSCIENCKEDYYYNCNLKES